MDKYIDAADKYEDKVAFGKSRQFLTRQALRYEAEASVPAIASGIGKKLLRRGFAAYVRYAR